MRTLLAVKVCLVLSLLTLTRPTPAASVDDFDNYSLVDNNGNTLLPGRLHVPSEYSSDPATPRPLILFLHGAGETGTNNVAQINGNIDNLLAAAKSRDAFIYAPQTGVGWANATILDRAMTMIDRAVEEYNADVDRIYITGLSMGGGGVWDFLNRFPDRVAASVPICGIPPLVNFMPANILQEPIWAFHGRLDENVPVEVTRAIVETLLDEAGLPHPVYPGNIFDPHTEYQFPPLDLRYTDMRGQHDIWGRVYNMEPMYEWLFAHGMVPEPGSVVLAFGALWPLVLVGRSSRRS